MKSRVLVAVFGCVGLGALGGLVQADAASIAARTASLPVVAAPPQGTAQWVARSMQLNGLPMTLKSFDTRLSVEDVLHHYEQWARGRIADESQRTRSGEWQVLSLRASTHLITIQARATRTGSHGTIAVTPPPDTASRALSSRFPIPPTMRIVNLQQYEDFGIESEHISVLSARAPIMEATAFATLLTNAGWQLTGDRVTRHTTRGHLVQAQKGAQHASITLLPDRGARSGTAAIIVWKKS